MTKIKSSDILVMSFLLLRIAVAVVCWDNSIVVKDVHVVGDGVAVDVTE